MAEDSPVTPKPKKSVAKRVPAKRKPAAKIKKPEDLTVAELETLLEKKRPEDTREVEAESSTVIPTLYARNLRNVPVSYRLARQNSKLGENRTQLKPRGQRGDVVKLEDGDLKDPVLSEQVAYGLIEIITESEALTAVSKQVHNQQTRVHPAMAYLRNENDKAYSPDAVKLQKEFNDAGTFVGTVSTDAPKNQSPIVRPGSENIGVTQLPIPQTLSEQARDAEIRSTKTDGPSAGLVGLSVAPLAPVQQTN